MCPKSRNGLSQDQRRARIEAVMTALRRFHLVDDCGLTELACSDALISAADIARALVRSRNPLPAGTPAEYVANAVLNEIVRRDQLPWTMRLTHQELEQSQVTATHSSSEVCKMVLESYRHQVEQRGLWKIVQGDEDRAQLVLGSFAESFCKANNIDMSREPATGRGPVDFKFSRGLDRVLVEVKRASNSSFWHGLEVQLPIYLQAESIESGYFLVIIESDADERRIADIETIISQVRSKVPYDVHTFVVDARRKRSASKA